ncbi:MAG: glycosyltransferase family 4 protein [Planctomycetota bacterium]
MRVLFIEAAYGFGGSLTGLLELLRYLPGDMDPIVVAPFDPWEYVDPMPGVKLEVVDVKRPLPKSGGHWIPGLWRYYRDYFRPWYRVTREMIHRHSPDIVHANNSLSINYGVGRAAGRLGVPAVCHQKDFEYDGRLMRMMAGKSPFPHHIAMSKSIQDQLVMLGVERSKCEVIFDPMTSPPEALYRQRQRRDHHRTPVVAMHSMVIHWKGQHVFLEAVAELEKRGRTDFTPVIAGSPPAGEPGYLDQLKRRSGELGIGERIRWAGHQANVYEFLVDVDIAVHASVDPEPFGRVVPEAMLMGIPGTVSTGGGPAEYVVDGEMGYHAPCGDAGALATAIEKLLDLTPEQRLAMGESARRHAIQQFAPEPLSRQMAGIYSRLLQSGSTAPASA